MIIANETDKQILAELEKISGLLERLIASLEKKKTSTTESHTDGTKNKTTLLYG